MLHKKLTTLEIRKKDFRPALALILGTLWVMMSCLMPFQAALSISTDSELTKLQKLLLAEGSLCISFPIQGEEENSNTDSSHNDCSLCLGNVLTSLEAKRSLLVRLTSSKKVVFFYSSHRTSPSTFSRLIPRAPPVA